MRYFVMNLATAIMHILAPTQDANDCLEVAAQVECRSVSIEVDTVDGTARFSLRFPNVDDAQMFSETLRRISDRIHANEEGK